MTNPTDYAMKEIRKCFEKASHKLWSDANKEAEDDSLWVDELIEVTSR